MKRFKFRLDTVIRYRRYLERMALMELAKVKLSLVQTEQHIQEMKSTKSNTIRELTDLVSAGMSVQKHRFYEAYVQGLEDNIEEKNNQILELEKEIEEKHKAVEDQRIKKEVLETMRRKAYKKHMAEAFLMEQKEADELANLRSRIPKF